MIHAIDAVTPGNGTDLEACFQRFGEHLSRRGLVAVISDLYCNPEQMSRAVQPLAYRGHDIMLVPAARSAGDAAELARVGTAAKTSRRSERSMSRPSTWRPNISSDSTTTCSRCGVRPRMSARISC